jgi:nitrogen regulatory protein PII
MKAIFISYNQAHTESVAHILDHFSVRGFTMFPVTHGRGMYDGEPHMGTHTWPALNSSMLVIVEEEKKVQQILDALRKLDSRTEMQGLRAFVWNVTDKM